MAHIFARAAVVAGVLACLASPVSAQESITLSFASGRVTLVAKDAPLNKVLAEWQRLGGTRFVNAERLPGTPVTIELKDIPERQALAVLLRPYSGYMASPGAQISDRASLFSVVLVMPTLARANPAPAPASASSFQPPAPSRPMNRGFGRPGIQVGVDPDADPTEVDPGDVQDQPDSLPPGMGPGAAFPGMPAAQQPDTYTDPMSAAPPGARPPGFPGTPGTATIPGMIVPATPPTGSGPPKPPKPPGSPNAPAPRP